MKALTTIIICGSILKILFGQVGENPYKLYTDKLILHTSLAINDAPFSLQDDFGNTQNLKYRLNQNIIHGIGISYKWLALNFSYKLPGHLRNKEAYGKTSFFDLGLQFSYSNWDFSIDYKEYKGFRLKNASELSPLLPLTKKGVYLNQNLKTRAFGLNAFRFLNSSLRMKPMVGVTGRYTEEAHGAYIRLTSNVHSVRANNGIIPYEYLNTSSSIHQANALVIFDFGAVPGYGYINNVNGWQFGAFAGIGAVIQSKFYSFSNSTRGFIGLAPRFGLSMQFGYNIDDWFLMFNTAVNQQNVRYSDFKYNQTYYTFKITYGYRFADQKMNNLLPFK